MENKETRPKISMFIDDALLKELDAEADRLNTTRSRLIENILTNFRKIVKIGNTDLLNEIDEIAMVQRRDRDTCVEIMIAEKMGAKFLHLVPIDARITSQEDQ